MKKLLVCAALFAATGAWAQVKSTIASEKGELWWGTPGMYGHAQPFAGAFTVDAPGNVVLVSSSGRYVWAEGCRQVAFDGRGFTIDSPAAAEAVKGGRNLREAYLVCRHKHCPPPADAAAPDKRPLEQPVYTLAEPLGEWVVRCADELLERNYPAGTLVLGEGWQDDDHGLEFDARYFSSPASMIDRLHHSGFRVMLTVTPCVPASGRGFRGHYVQNDLMTDSTDMPMVKRTRNGWQACLNINRKMVAETIKNRLHELREIGVDGILLDLSELALFMDKTELAAAVAAWEKATDGMTLQFIAQPTPATGNGKIINLEFPVHQVAANEFPVDQVATNGSPIVLNAMFAHGFMGNNYCYPFWSRPFEDRSFPQLSPSLPDACTLFPVSSIPVWSVEGLFPDLTRKYFKARAAMTPYILELAAESAKTGEPLVRPMEYNFPRAGFSDCNDQFMIGMRYLVAPALNDDAKRTVRLPKGSWVDASGKRHRGPVVIEARCDEGPAVFELVK